MPIHIFSTTELPKPQVPPAPPQPRVSTTLRARLNTIDAWLCTHDPDAKELWNVLTALRGPDNGDPSAKHDLTMPVRTAAFPRTAAVHFTQRDGLGATFDNPEAPSKLIPRSTVNSHFTSHAINAAKHLGILA